MCNFKFIGCFELLIQLSLHLQCSLKCLYKLYRSVFIYIGIKIYYSMSRFPERLLEFQCLHLSELPIILHCINLCLYLIKNGIHKIINNFFIAYITYTQQMSSLQYNQLLNMVNINDSIP